MINYCKTCGKELRHLGAIQCRECYSQSRKTNISKTICAVCGKEFQCIPSRMAKREKLCCSRECSIILRNKRTTRECNYCRKMFIALHAEVQRGGAKYCCKECYNADNRIEKVCPICKKKFIVSKSLSNRTYCSIPCKGIGQRRGNKTLLVAIRSTSRYYEWRKKVYEKYLFRCAKCGDKITNKKRPHAHHIILLADLLTQYNINTLEQALCDERIWDIDNGILYCKQCHTLHHSNLKLQMEIEV